MEQVLGLKTGSESKQSQGAVISCCVFDICQVECYYSLPVIRRIELTIVRAMLKFET